MRLELRTERRGYLLILEQDLLGDFVLFRHWYGLQNRRGGIKRQVFLDEESARREFVRVQKLRVRRGYRPISQEGSP
jgi:predicted DNA-binding WGR domain protein